MGWTRFVYRRRWDEERAREIAAHLAHEIDEQLARGLAPGEARRAAYRKFGNPGLVREEIYEMNTVPLVDTFVRDLHYGARLLRRNPTFAIVAILTLALGTGANTAMFQLIDALMLRALPVERPQDLLELKILNATHGRTGMFLGSRPSFSNPVWERIKEQQQVFSGVLAWMSNARWDLAGGGESRPVQGLYVSGGYFSTLGIHAQLGRVLTEADDRPGCASPGAVISHAFWRREYGGDPSVVGKTVVLDGHRFDVIGVTPASFYGTEVGRTFDVALPLCTEPIFRGARSTLRRSDAWMVGVFGRLKPGVTPEQAAAQLRAISAGIFRETVPPSYPPPVARDYETFAIGTLPAAAGFSTLRATYGESLTVLLVLTGVVLLIACANLANLMLARATTREREIAVRLAIGASRRRIVRQLLSESLVIAAIGAAAGLFAASWFSRALVGFLSADDGQIFVDLAPDWRVFAFTAAVASAACLVFGLLPAVRATRTEPGAVMKASSRAATDSGERFGLRRALVVLQFALSLVLVVGALLFVRSLWKLTHIDPGFRQDGVLQVSVDYRNAAIPAEQRPEFDRRILERLSAIPGVTAAARVFAAPLSGNFWNNQVVVGGVEQQSLVNFNSVTAAYFRAVSTPLIAGREFDDRDTPQSPRVAIVTQSFARQFFPSGSAIGQTFQIAGEAGEARPFIKIVGVAKDTKYTDMREPFQPAVYMNAEQDTDRDATPRFLLHATTALPGVTAAATRALAEVNGTIVVHYQTLLDIVGGSLQRDRLMATLSGFFGVLAVLIATIGLYGVMAYTVARRKVEIGIRMALGADRASIMGLVLREACVLAGLGALVGLALAIQGARAAMTLLYGLQPWDAPTLAAAVGILGAVTIVASWLPAHRAARIDPAIPLREQ